MKEEITDMIKPEAIAKIKVGTVLRFNYEGSITNIKVTRKTKDRIWGKHIEMHDYNKTMTHYDHAIDTTLIPAWCDDCNCPIHELSNAFGRARAHERRATDEARAKEKESPEENSVA